MVDSDFPETRVKICASEKKKPLLQSIKSD